MFAQGLVIPTKVGIHYFWLLRRFWIPAGVYLVDSRFRGKDTRGGNDGHLCDRKDITKNER